MKISNKIHEYVAELPWYIKLAPISPAWSTLMIFSSIFRLNRSSQLACWLEEVEESLTKLKFVWLCFWGVLRRIWVTCLVLWGGINTLMAIFSTIEIVTHHWSLGFCVSKDFSCCFVSCLLVHETFGLAQLRWFVSAVSFKNNYSQDTNNETNKSISFWHIVFRNNSSLLSILRWYVCICIDKE